VSTPGDAHRRLIDYLTRTYGDRLFRRDGIAYPVMVYPAGPEASGDPDGLLASGFPRHYADPAEFTPYAADHLRDRRRTHPHMTNGVSYMLDELTPEPLHIRGRLGYYFDMIATCDALDQELRAYGRGQRDDTPLRDAFHRAIPPQQALTSGRGRAAIIGGAVLTMYRCNGAYEFILGQRSQRVSVGVGLYHVVPAFVYQPSGPPGFYADDWSIRHQVAREFGEELFGMPEYVDWQPQPETATYFYDHPPVAELKAMLAEGRAELHLTGVAFNLLSLRPEVCALLIIHDEDWYLRRRQTLHKVRDDERQATHYIPLDTLAGLPDDPHIHLTPHGAAALWLGVERARVLTSGA
jgi:hypothetical protein